MPAVKLCTVQVGVEGGVSNEDIIGVSVTGFFLQSSQDVFEEERYSMVLP